MINMGTTKLEAYWFLNSGVEFKNAYYILIGSFIPSQQTWSDQIERPSYYCAGFAIENFLKSYLVFYDISFDKHGREGHNLQRLLDSHDNLIEFFKFTNDEYKNIELLNQRYYADTLLGKDDLRYPNKFGKRESPQPDFLYEILMKMEKQLKGFIFAQKFS